MTEKVVCQCCGATLEEKIADVRLVAEFQKFEDGEKVLAVSYFHPEPLCERWKSRERAFCLP